MTTDTARFSDLFGAFPTPIAIVTAMGPDDEPYGFTSNAICAVSASSPTLLISVGTGSRTLGAIQFSQAFAVNFLSASGRAASQLFAGKALDKFGQVLWEPSDLAGRAPLLTEIALGYAECRVEQAIQVRDHWLFIARVAGTAVFPREPLLYRQGVYSTWAPPRQTDLITSGEGKP